MMTEIMGLQSFPCWTDILTDCAHNTSCVHMFSFNVALHSLSYMSHKVTICALEILSINIHHHFVNKLIKILKE